jgi:hypothetical protein
MFNFAKDSRLDEICFKNQKLVFLRLEDDESKYWANTKMFSEPNALAYYRPKEFYYKFCG